MTLTLLQASKLSVKRGGKVRCDRLDMTVPEQTCWGILGPNGAGKTSLLLALCGLLQAKSGSILLQGQELTDIQPRARAAAIGVLFQEQEPALPCTLLEYVLGGRHPHRASWGWDNPADLTAARAALAESGLLELQDHLTSRLSGGERQRLEIARLLAQSPKIALLDEPSNHLDPGQQISMLNLLKARFSRPGHALIMVLHDLNLCLRYCDHLLLLAGDGSWKAGKTEYLANEQNLSELYKHPMRQISEGAIRVFVPD